MSYTPYVARAILGRQLAKYRKRAKLAIPEASRETGISESKLRKLERGVNPVVRLPDVYSCTLVYDCSSSEKNHLRDLVNGAEQPGWYHDYNVPTAFAHFIEQESVAETVHIHETELVHGLFQTPAYLEALRHNRPDPNQEPDQGLRRERQERVLSRDKPPKINYLTSEAALRRHVGNDDVMREQIEHLGKVNSWEFIDIFVMTFSAGPYPATSGPFTVMEFDSTFPNIVYIESAHGSKYEEGDRVPFYLDVMERSINQAEPLEEFIRGYTMA